MSDDIFAAISAKAPIVPVLVVDDTAHAAPLARALQNGGALAVEVTLRTEAALKVIAAMKAACPSLLVGAGTVLTEGDVDACVKAGTDFIVTPGTSPALIEALLDCPVPICPGVNTPSEAMTLLDMGFAYQKFFPAGASGGAPFLKALSGPLKAISFMPTGGVSEANMNDYLGLPNVFAVGGSWLAPADLLAKGGFDEIGARTRQAIESVKRSK